MDLWLLAFLVFAFYSFDNLEPSISLKVFVCHSVQISTKIKIKKCNSTFLKIFHITKTSYICNYLLVEFENKVEMKKQKQKIWLLVVAISSKHPSKSFLPWGRLEIVRCQFPIQENSFSSPLTLVPQKFDHLPQWKKTKIKQQTSAQVKLKL